MKPITENKVNFIQEILNITRIEIALIIDFPSTLDKIFIKTVQVIPEVRDKFNRLYKVARACKNICKRSLNANELALTFGKNTLRELLADEKSTKIVKRVFKSLKN